MNTQIKTMFKALLRKLFPESEDTTFNDVVEKIKTNTSQVEEKPKTKLVKKLVEREQNSINVKVTLFLHSLYVGENPKVEYTFKANYGWSTWIGRRVYSGNEAYYDWFEKNKNVNIISLGGIPYLISNIKEITKEEIPVVVKYQEEIETLEEIKDETSNN